MNLKEKDLVILNDFFLHNSYIDYFQISSKDILLHKRIDKASIYQYLNLSRWYRHIEIILQDNNSQIILQEASNLKSETIEIKTSSGKVL